MILIKIIISKNRWMREINFYQNKDKLSNFNFKVKKLKS